jgi:MYXO-CTERM domain-containing protein
MATLSPLRFAYDSQELTLPIRLGLANSKGTQDLIVNVLAPNNTRYEVANHPNVTIPTNLPVTDAVRTRFGEFYAALFDHALEQKPGAVVTEYAWDASSCDPCPGPTLDGNDLQTFGGNVLGARYQDVHGYTLTRLHARYGTEVKDDLSFRAVEPIAGGRGIPDAHGEMSSQVTHEGINNFQGRYVILHPWTGALSCEAPKRGVWGGPNKSQQIAAPLAATNLAFAPRGNVQLASLLAKDVPSAGLLSSKGQTPPIAIEHKGCGCHATGDGAGAFASAGFVALVLLRRRHR